MFHQRFPMVVKNSKNECMILGSFQSSKCHPQIHIQKLQKNRLRKGLHNKTPKTASQQDSIPVRTPPSKTSKQQPGLIISKSKVKKAKTPRSVLRGSIHATSTSSTAAQLREAKRGAVCWGRLIRCTPNREICANYRILLYMVLRCFAVLAWNRAPSSEAKHPLLRVVDGSGKERTNGSKTTSSPLDVKMSNTI